MNSKKVLIIGGNGFIGMNLVRKLSEHGYQVTSFDLVKPSIRYDQVEYIEGNFFDQEFLEKMVQEKDVVIHAISTINPTTSNDRYMQGYENDFLQTVRLCEILEKTGGKLIFLSSGGTVYGRQEVQPITEKAPTMPINHYAALKLCIENVLCAFHAQKKIRTVIARISNPFGPGQDYKKGVGFIDAALKKALAGEVMEIWGDGETIRDYIAIDDVCEMLEALIEYEGSEVIFNISSGRGVSQNEILKLLGQMHTDLQVVYKQGRGVDLKKTVLDNTKIQSICPKQPKSFEQGFAEYYEWLKKEFQSEEQR